MKKLTKCPRCHCPLDVHFTSNEEIRYRCSVCGHQTTQKIGDEERSEAITADTGAEASESA